MLPSSQDQINEKGLLYLSEVDPILGGAIKKIILSKRSRHKDYFFALVQEIISQQLSGRAADVIEARFIKLFSSKPFPRPEEILAMPDQNIRAAGMSFQKISYIKNVALAVVEKRIDFENIEVLSDEEIIAKLVAIKGIGRWTAEMFLMFTLARPDVFSYGDLGLRKAMKKIYHLRKEPSPKNAAQISNRWRPHRTLACRYLWASLDL